MQLDALEFKQGLGGQVAFAATRTTDIGHVLDDEKVIPMAIAARDAPYLHTALTTDIADHKLTHYSRKTLISTSLSVALNLATTRFWLNEAGVSGTWGADGHRHLA